MDPAIRMEGLGKRYPKGIQPNLVIERIRRAKPLEWFWALRDVSFQVERGESLGIVGRNGAGKSTLLRILARITRPTEGRADLFGRVSAVLDVGTGFHPELTGRENIYLNGALLGLREEQIRGKIADIIDFSEIADFIDTPFKRYSTGMMARLGFSVMIHLDTEILLIDEALEAGDAVFRKKCAARLRELVRKDRTIVFVGHQAALMTDLCDRLVWLERGRVRAEGNPAAIMEEYLDGHSEKSDSAGR